MAADETLRVVKKKKKTFNGFSDARVDFALENIAVRRFRSRELIIQSKLASIARVFPIDRQTEISKAKDFS